MPRKPETESTEKTSTESDTVNLSPEELRSIWGGFTESVMVTKATDCKTDKGKL
jgi:hypothetical protein